MNFNQKLVNSIKKVSSTLCTGIDPNPRLFPDEIKRSGKSLTDQTKEFCEAIISETAPYSCGYKFNLAFFEALGYKGWEVIEELVATVPKEKIILADAKRGDIGNTAKMYAKAFFDEMNVDAVTINPLMGSDSIIPWLDYPGKAVFVLGLTSNPGSADFLLQEIKNNGIHLFELIAKEMRKHQKDKPTVIGLVAGATQTHNLKLLGDQFPEAPLLIPGIGAQGGSIEDVLKSLQTHKGLLLPAVSRSIIYASNGDDWREKMAKSSEQFALLLQSYSLSVS